MPRAFSAPFVLLVPFAPFPLSDSLSCLSATSDMSCFLSSPFLPSLPLLKALPFSTGVRLCLSGGLGPPFTGAFRSGCEAFGVGCKLRRGGSSGFEAGFEAACDAGFEAAFVDCEAVGTVGLPAGGLGFKATDLTLITVEVIRAPIVCFVAAGGILGLAVWASGALDHPGGGPTGSLGRADSGGAFLALRTILCALDCGKVLTAEVALSGIVSFRAMTLGCWC